MEDMILAALKKMTPEERNALMNSLRSGDESGGEQPVIVDPNIPSGRYPNNRKSNGEIINTQNRMSSGNVPKVSSGQRFIGNGSNAYSQAEMDQLSALGRPRELTPSDKMPVNVGQVETSDWGWVDNATPQAKKVPVMPRGMVNNVLPGDPNYGMGGVKPLPNVLPGEVTGMAGVKPIENLPADFVSPEMELLIQKLSKRKSLNR